MSKKKKLVKKALKYIKLIEQSKYYQKCDVDTLGLLNDNDFTNLIGYRKGRIEIHSQMQKKMQKRVNELLKIAINE
jgi:hypothetical protein